MVRLYSLMIQALHADPAIRLICPKARDGYIPTLDTPSMISVLRIAAEIESSVEEILTWYTSVKIHELGGITAQELIAMGQTEAVVNFLISIRDGDRE